ncbi:helix-turn-helix domain-containing protein [Streptomyces griseorubiginosus]|uniref:helix-turn-helix domain-containing protein n=1 Tax=Streptomyces griseorubiginosus TaxID=67304 RepID=UPI0033B00FB0
MTPTAEQLDRTPIPVAVTSSDAQQVHDHALIQMELTVQPRPEAVLPSSYPPEFRRKVLASAVSGRKVAEVAQLLAIREQTIYVWRRQRLIDTGLLPGTTTAENAELTAVRDHTP